MVSSADICLKTGLSQLHNLYFVAYGHSIYVYIPQFSSQEIGQRPSLIFTSQPSGPRLSGYLDQHNPHSVNSLIVEQFGTEEVVAVVRDDGDVDAFLVRHIVQAIERRCEDGSTIGVRGDEIRPFFQSNVGISAWGLAIHSEARILATSSNAHEIRVFKFGLLRSESPKPTDSESSGKRENVDDLSDGTSRQHTQRETDVDHHVLNGETNIPYIAFCNTGDDPEARWLLTTDISGVCRVMDLHSLEPVQAFRFGRSFASVQTGGFDRLNAGWAIMFLDRRSFRPVLDAASALGVDDDAEDRTIPKVYRNGEVWDLTNTARRLYEFAEPFMLHQTKTDNVAAASNEDRDDSSDSVELSPVNNPSDADQTIRYERSSDEEADTDLEIAGQEDYLEDEEDGGIGVEVTIAADLEDNDDGGGIVWHTANEDDQEQLRETAVSSQYSSSSPDSEPLDDDMLVDDGEDPDDEGTEDTISYASVYNGESIVGNDARFVHPLKPLCDNLPCPIVHASVRNIYLLQPSKQKVAPQYMNSFISETAFQPPLLGYANPLKQPIHQNFGYLRIFERLNMNASIPPLGLVILASQKGRALVLSLNRLTPSTTFPSTLRDFSCDDRSVYGMKIEAILPFADQERQNLRSAYPLHGIAVSPLQGSEGRKNGRWRLMMMYQDHSILSYELSRSNGARDSGVDIGTVVV